MRVCMYVLACVCVRAVSLAVVVSGHGTMDKYYVFIPALSSRSSQFLTLVVQ